MLDELVVHNLGVLADARLAPGEGFTVVTGETGAGKTLLVGALSALGSGRLDQKRIGPSDDEVSVSARFASDGTERVVRASLGTGGRTRSYVDGAAATVAEVAAIVEAEIDVVAQHDGLALRREASVRALVDAALDEAGRSALASHEAAWDAFVEARERLAELGGDPRAVRREADLARHEADEIAAAGLGAGEDEELVARVARLANAEELSGTVAELEVAVDAAAEAAATAVDLGRRIRRLDETADFGVDGVAAELAETASAARAYRERLVFDPTQLAEAQERIAAIGSLKRRYGATIDEVIAYGEEAAARAERLTALVDDAARLAQEVEDTRDAATRTAEALAEARARAAERLADDAMAHLRELGFTDPYLGFTSEAAPLGRGGAERLGLAFASDRRLEPGPLASTASGGELSRAVLALRLAAGVGTSPVVVFDEVDAGVGGATALALGAKLATVARSAQVLCVTHLPQVAAHAGRHFVVERSETRAEVRLVEGEERLDELTRMLSGLTSEQGREHARELLAAAAGA
jgi:DNA repair protein RecN (Recombination protein N)